MRTRTGISQAHRFQWLGSFGHPGNGFYREELRRGLAAISRYLAAHQFPRERCLLRLDGHYGRRSVLADLAGFAGCRLVARRRPPLIIRLCRHVCISHQISFNIAWERRLVRSLYDCPQVPVGPAGVRYRVVLATHPQGRKKRPVGVTRQGVVYELFFTNVPQQAFTTSDVVELYAAIAGPSSLRWRMKTPNKTQIAGALTQPGDKNAGRWSHNGSGRSV